ncbi:MAG: cytochrome c biogenesis protein ResB [Candidatus Omnitrophica bacterium]|nr:cytochrome c biogenesis protein ResB [Candidatus Omnitrophota bacterium]
MKLFWKFGSLKLTYILFFTIAFSSLLGTLLVTKGAGNPYQGWIYNGLVGFLGINLFVCVLKNSMSVFRGRQKKTAFILLHFSVLLVFCGALFSWIKKETKYFILLPGQQINFGQADTKIIFKNLDIEYYPETTLPKDYRSRVFLIEGGLLKQERIIRVNQPLKYKGYSFYQTDFKVFAELDIKIKQAGRIIYEGRLKQPELLSLPENPQLKVGIKNFVPDALIDEQGQVYLNSYKIGNSSGVLFGIYKQDRLWKERWVFNGDLAQDVLSEQQNELEFEVKNLSLFYVTILQAVKDPGIGIIWSGFTLLTLSLAFIVFQKLKQYKADNNKRG